MNDTILSLANGYVTKVVSVELCGSTKLDNREYLCKCLINLDVSDLVVIAYEEEVYCVGRVTKIDYLHDVIEEYKYRWVVSAISTTEYERTVEHELGIIRAYKERRRKRKMNLLRTQYEAGEEVGSNMDDASYDYEGIEEEDFGHKTTRRSRRKSK